MSKESIITCACVFGGFIASLFGGWDGAMTTLLIFMAVDYITGIIVAGVFKNSRKTENGALESRAGFKGLCRKGVILLVVLVAYRLDLVMNTSFLKNTVVVSFILNETLSIAENVGLMGLKWPEPLANAIEVLTKISKGDMKK